MSGSPGFASAEAGGGRPPRVLAIGLNWIGDTIMAMPAIRAWRRRRPDARLRILARRPMDELWRRHGAADEVDVLPPGAAGTLRAGMAQRRWRPDVVVVMPHSIRSTLLALMCGAPARWALTGAGRSRLGFHVVAPPAAPAWRHQQFEYAALWLGADAEWELDAPRIAPTEEDRRAAAALLHGVPPGRRVAVMPGAARGESKRWPADRFAAVAARLAAEEGCAILAMGSASERSACEAVAVAAGARGRNLAGRTTLPLWAAVLAACDMAIANDSGGAHLAAAVGVAGVAVFGRTDPERTGPLHPGWRIVAAPGPRARDVSRADRDAVRRLLAIPSEAVYAACRAVLAEGTQPSGGGLATPDAER